MKATATRPTYVVRSDGKKVLLKKGESADVDGRTYSDGHKFVKAGYLTLEKPEPKPEPKRKAKPEPEPAPEPDNDA